MADPNTNRPAPPILQSVEPQFLDLVGWNVYDWIYDPAQSQFYSSHGLPHTQHGEQGTNRVLDITGKGVISFLLFGMESRVSGQRQWQADFYIDGNNIMSRFINIPGNKPNLGLCVVGSFMLSDFEINLAGFCPGHLSFENSLAVDLYHEGLNDDLQTKMVYDIALT